MSDLNWIYGILIGHGIEASGKPADWAFDQLEVLRESGKLTEKESKICDERIGKSKDGAGKETAKKLPKKKIVKVNMDADIQKQFDKAEPKERVKIAFRYIMDNLRGKYPAEDGRVVAIEKVGADKMSHTLNETKIRVLPELAKLIEAGELEGVVESEKEGGRQHKLFTHFAYYKVSFQIGDERYTGRLNVGIRKDGSSTLYDLNPFNKI